MKYLLLILTLCVSFTAHAQINQQCPDLTVNGAPTYQPHPGDQELCHANYAVIYRCDVKSPVAVFEHLTKEDMTGPAKRKNNFHPDSAVTPACSATLADYATVGSKMDRGHMSPAGNNTENDAIMSESFDLSNMVAQVANNNRGIWKQLETFERQWAMAPGTDFYIISGGIFDPGHFVTGNGLSLRDFRGTVALAMVSKIPSGSAMPRAAMWSARDWVSATA